MTDHVQTPRTDRLIEQLCAGAHERKVRSIRLIARLCREQAERGSDDYTVATIGKLSAEKGGPASGAIRNRSGEAYRAVIRSFADEVGGQSRYRRKPKRAEEDAVLEGITDPVTRTRVNLLLAENRSLKGQLQGLRRLVNKSLSISIEGGKEETATRQEEREELSALERRALERSVAPETLEHWGWIEDSEGRVTSKSGQTVMHAGFTTGVRKALREMRGQAGGRPAERGGNGNNERQHRVDRELHLGHLE